MEQEIRFDQKSDTTAKYKRYSIVRRVILLIVHEIRFDKNSGTSV